MIGDSLPVLLFVSLRVVCLTPLMEQNPWRWKRREEKAARKSPLPFFSSPNFPKRYVLPCTLTVFAAITNLAILSDLAPLSKEVKMSV